MKFYATLLILMAAILSVSGQKYITQTGSIKFFSEAPLENIESTNNQVSSVMDMETGNIAFSLLMKAFNFEKALMQEHFNEKYIESDKFPKSSFKGQIKDFNADQLLDVEQDVTVDGSLTIHGVTKEVSIPGKLKLDGDKLLGTSTFYIEVADYEIKIPATVRDNIAKSVEVTVNLEYEKME